MAPSLTGPQAHREAGAADARLVAAQIPGATLKILPGRDHLPWAGDWPAVAGEILAFLAQVAPPGKGQARVGRPGSRPPRPWPRN